jgi:hypothetical protein
MALHQLNGYHPTADDQTDTETERVWATLPKSLVAELDNYHYGMRFKNRSHAIRALIMFGLEANGVGRPKGKPDA